MGATLSLLYIAHCERQEHARAVSLREAENKAVAFFDEIAATILRPGISEKELSDEIGKLAGQRHGLGTSVQPNPPDRVIEEGDLMFVDLGLVFAKWEADLGRTFIMPSPTTVQDPVVQAAKQKLVDALEPMWYTIKARYFTNPSMSGEELYVIACDETEKEGYEWGAEHAGHIIGDFPHERVPKAEVKEFIMPGNKTVMSAAGKGGWKRHWILEFHLRDPVLGLKGFFEQVLTVD